VENTILAKLLQNTELVLLHFPIDRGITDLFYDQIQDKYKGKFCRGFCPEQPPGSKWVKKVLLSLAVSTSN
jgi:hypothetical protein